MDAIEGRMHALQRIAFGADASDAERAEAVAELADLAAHRGDAPGALSADGPGGDRSAETAHPAAGRAAADGTPDDDVPASRRLLRWTITAGGIGLLLGAAIGWGAGQSAPADSGSSTDDPSASAELGTPLEQTELLPMFDRLPLAAEATRVAGADDMIDPESVRLLATRVDGPSAYLARTVDGENVCLVLLLPAGPSRSTCTEGARIPADGLSIQYSAPGYGLAVARLATTGMVGLGLIVTF